jgi:hypothetical protein
LRLRASNPKEAGEALGCVSHPSRLNLEAQEESLGETHVWVPKYIHVHRNPRGAREAAAVAQICHSYVVGAGAHNIHHQMDGVPITHDNNNNNNNPRTPVALPAIRLAMSAALWLNTPHLLSNLQALASRGQRLHLSTG